MTSLAVSKGVVYAGTTGGLLVWTDKTVRHFTREDGLPGLRIRHLEAATDGIRLRAEKSALFRRGSFSAIPDWQPPQVNAPSEIGAALSRIVFRGKTWWVVPLKGLIQVQGNKLVEFKPSLPSRLATCAVVDSRGRLVVGTSDQGAFRLEGSRWMPLPLPTKRLVREAVAMTRVGSHLWIAPRHGRAFDLAGATAKASAQPWRQSVIWNGNTVVRRGDGVLVQVSAHGTETPMKLQLPRRTATALCVDGKTLYVAQQGGWSEFEDQLPPRHRFDIEPLKSRPTTAILVSRGNVYVGTQNNGLVRISQSTGDVAHFHEVHGLKDDWITALETDISGSLLIGTFVGGLHRLHNEQSVVVGLAGGTVTRIIRQGSRVWVGSLNGVRQWNGHDLLEPVWNKWIEPDVTDLILINDELWIAAGGALYRNRVF